MINEKIFLSEHFQMLKSSAADFDANLTAYIPSNTPELSVNKKRPAIIICPGGGYGFTSDREAEPIALSFAGEDFNAFVLRYSVAPARYPGALLELSAAVAFVRRNAEKYNVDKDAIIVCGFSAGGHLAGSLGVFWDEFFIEERLGIAPGENKPNAMILSYPVITSGEKAHRGSFENLLGEDVHNKEMLDKMSLEKQVSAKTPMVFIWHTFNDDIVPVENSLLMADALAKNNIPFELHIYQEGPHGLSLCDKITSRDSFFVNHHVKSWMPLCKEWINLNFSGKK